MKNFNVFVAGLVAAMASGCASHRIAATPAVNATIQTAALPAASGEAADSAEPSMRNALLHPVSDLKTVTFDFDSNTLTDASRNLLAENAAWLKDHPEVMVKVEGSCDQRGTEAYNLALGQRRAKAVRDYYMTLGVAGKRVATLSYGKEKPLCQESTEACWQRNRRAETLAAYDRVNSRAD